MRLALMQQFWPPVILAAIGICLFIAAWSYLPAAWGAPWVPTSARTVKKMLQMADVKPGQRVVDLGAGDGRIVIVAARQFGAQAVGVEIDPVRCLIANTLILVSGLGKKAHVYHGNMYTFDLKDADVVTLYLLQGTNQKIKERLSEQLKPGAKIVSHTFSMVGWIPAALDDTNDIFLYEVGNVGSEVQTRFV
jgi:SAM-dependent methyltransferase